MTREKLNNEAKKDRIEILKGEHDAISKKLNNYRDTT
jgi:hypothetical protein